MRKFRGLVAMEDSLWREQGDPGLWRVIDRPLERLEVLQDWVDGLTE